jgi:hypothetical protein
MKHTSSSAPRRPRRKGVAGILLLEVSVALGFTALLAIIVMKASLLALSNHQWTIMQTLTDAYLTRETALSNRVPMADLIAPTSPWPDSAVDVPPRSEQTVVLGKLAGGRIVNATLMRFRANEKPVTDPDTGIAVWRLHSVLSYRIGEQPYVKSRSTLRMQ